jgi:hypothetical protein
MRLVAKQLITVKVFINRSTQLKFYLKKPRFQTRAITKLSTMVAPGETNLKKVKIV